MNDPFELQRFVDVQGRVIGQVRAELHQGRKTSHWMWFVFPQLRGLGSSPMAIRYGISGRGEARAYFDHPVLGQRLVECCRLLLEGEDDDIHAILGSPDDMKFRSCVTLFEAVAPEEGVFAGCLERFYRGERDGRTLDQLS